MLRNVSKRDAATMYPRPMCSQTKIFGYCGQYLSRVLHPRPVCPWPVCPWPVCPWPFVHGFHNPLYCKIREQLSKKWSFLACFIGTESHLLFWINFMPLMKYPLHLGTFTNRVHWEEMMEGHIIQWLFYVGWQAPRDVLYKGWLVQR